MKLEELKVYNLAMEIGEEVWNLVSTWKWFEKESLGKQFVKAADSIAANISEGFGRYYFKDSKNFYYYSRGSLSESKTWLQKAHTRKLITDMKFEELKSKMESTGAMLNSYIHSIGSVSPRV
ncbi:MAG: four helix bundle protein [Bacteroidetes bacterium]|nr:four helix bundle protein [Bacteroidota bacterium]